MNKTTARLKTCGGCHHGKPPITHGSGRVLCHRFPPTVVPTMGINPVTNQPEPGAMALFAEVPETQSCGEWKRREK